MALLMSTTGFLAACNSGDNSSSGNSGSVSSSDSAGTSSSEEMGEVKSLTITNKPEGNQLYVGADRSVTLGYTTDPADAQVSVKWTSGDPAIATVDENGKVTGIKPGSVVITVTAEGTNISAKLPLTVLEYVEPKPVTAISISGVEETSTIKRGETKTIEIVSEPADCDPYEIEWTYNKDIIDVVEAPEGFNIVAKAYGTTDVVATVMGTEIKDSISVSVEGDVDYENGIMTETFARGTLDPNGIYYTSADKTTSTQKPMYHGTFFDVGARTNSTTPSEISLAEEAIEWTIYSPTLNERAVFHYNGEIDPESSYLVRIPVTAKAVTEESAINTKLYYGYRVTASEDDLGLSYYINKEYRDLILPEEDFTTAYDDLCDWLEDNCRVQRDADELFNVYNMYDINIYLDDGKKSTGRTGESRRTARENYIRLYSVGGFSFCYIYHVFSHIGEEGFLSYTICQSRADKSEYAKLAHYYLLTVQASYPYSEKVKEKESYLETLKLYNKKSITPASAETFNFWLYADCFSALYTEEGKSFINMLQDLSRLRYIALTYGEEYIAKLNADLDILIEGKTFDEVTHEWRDYLQILKEE